MIVVREGGCDASWEGDLREGTVGIVGKGGGETVNGFGGECTVGIEGVGVGTGACRFGDGRGSVSVSGVTFTGRRNFDETAFVIVGVGGGDGAGRAGTGDGANEITDVRDGEGARRAVGIGVGGVCEKVGTVREIDGAFATQEGDLSELFRGVIGVLGEVTLLIGDFGEKVRIGWVVIELGFVESGETVRVGGGRFGLLVGRL